MATRTVTVDGFTYEGRWWLNPDEGRYSGLHIIGPLEYKRPTRGFYGRSGEWVDVPTGRCDSPRTDRWWRAARQLVDLYNKATL